MWSASAAVLREALTAYSQNVADLGSDELTALDRWVWNELTCAVAERHALSAEELQKLMKWKLLRGKFRPGLQSKVSSNDDALVQSCTRDAWHELAAAASADASAATAAGDAVRKALDVLTTQLHGVGPATASAILAVMAPHRVAFMSDEAMAAVPGLKAGSYTVATFEAFNRAMCERAEALAKEEEEEEKAEQPPPPEADQRSSVPVQPGPKRLHTMASADGKPVASTARERWTPCALERALYSLQAADRKGSKVGKRKR